MDMVFVIVCGCVLGSFLNTCIYRLPLQQSLLYPPSHCPQCGARLRKRDLIPVVSWLILKGRCHNCQGDIAWQYVCVELLTAGLAAWIYVQSSSTEGVICSLVLVCFLICISFIDYKHGVILDTVLLLFGVLGLAGNIVWPRLPGADLLLGSCLGGGSLLLLLLLTRGGMGGGDVKFALALGLWVGWQNIIVLLLLAFLLGGSAGILLLASGRKKYADAVPFGPFLSAAAFISYLYGDAIRELYWELLL